MHRLLWLLPLLFAGWGGIASAQPFMPCPFVTVSIAFSYPPPMTQVVYSGDQLILFAEVNGEVHAYSGVPIGVMQGMRLAPNPYAYYQSAVMNNYHELLLAEQNNCPLLFENGALIWSR